MVARRWVNQPPSSSPLATTGRNPEISGIDYDSIAPAFARTRKPHPVVLRELLERSDVSLCHAVLEIGCGTGNYVSAIRTAVGCRCTGVDPSRRMLAAAAERRAGLHLVRAAAERLPLSNESVDLAFSVDVMHHVSDPGAYFSEARRVLRPAGVICTVTESAAMIRARRPLSNYFPETVAPELVRYPEVGALRTLMGNVGFEVEDEVPVKLADRIHDIEPFREKAFSTLLLIGPADFRRGLRRMEQDLARGPIAAISRYLMLWARRS